MSTESASEAARQRGNEFYRKGQFPQAEKAYKEAAELDPESHTPWSNISALRFEQGNYSDALQSIDKALALLPPEVDDGQTQQKLYTRKAKCHLHLLLSTDVDEVLQNLNKNSPNDGLRSSLKEIQDLRTTAPDETIFRKQVFDRLPRYKGSVLDATEYYAMGHDTAEALLDEELKSSITSDSDIAFLLCGSGDARHLLRSIADLFLWEKLFGSDGSSKFNRAHFTLVDINAAALAKTLIMFDMFVTYVIMKSKNMPRIEDALTNMAYVYSSAFVPQFVVEKMMENMNSLIYGFEKDIEKGLPGSTVLNMLYLPGSTRTQVLQKLKQWIEPMPDEYSTRSLRPSSAASLRALEQKQRDNLGTTKEDSRYPKQCKQDVNAFGVLFAERIWLERRDPELIPLLDSYRSGGSGSKQALEEHIDSKWKTNPTVIDLDYQRQRKDEEDLTPDNEKPKLDWNPADLLQNFAMHLGTLGAKKSAIECLSGAFERICLSVMSLMGRIDIEVIAREMSDVMERLQHNCLEHRSHKVKGEVVIDPTSFPRKYDRIQMSNIPDYVGGPLTAHMYGCPLLRTDRPSDLRFNCLMNPPLFKTHEDFLAEYLLMYEPEKIANHFGLVRINAPDLTKSSHSPLALRFGTFVLENYFKWTHSGVDRIPRNKMMARPALEHWLYGHLLKICLPHGRPVITECPVYAPLNLTVFFRLIVRMHEVGYPAHWLSDILATISTGTIKTTARAPRQIALNTEEVSKHYPSKKISLGPFKTEYTTLLSIWRRILPFGILTPTQTLVPIDQIMKCTITFPDFPHYYGKAPHFAIIFFDTDIIDDPEDLKLPDVIQDDHDAQDGDTSPFAGRFCERGIHMVSAFRYVTETRTASFWMRRDVVGEMLRNEAWMVGLCRTDIWQLLPPSVEAAQDILRQVGPWTESDKDGS